MAKKEKRKIGEVEIYKTELIEKQEQTKNATKLFKVSVWILLLS